MSLRWCLLADAHAEVVCVFVKIFSEPCSMAFPVSENLERMEDLARAPMEVVLQEEVDRQTPPDIKEPKHHVYCRQRKCQN